ARAAIADGSDGLSIPRPIGSRRADAIPVVPKVRFSNTASGDATIVEVEGRDRPGLLWEVAAVLRDYDLEVLSAHIEGLGEKAVDAFYVRRSGPDPKIPDSLRRQVRADLKAVLADGEAIAA
ncbi:MAG: ACT domain-containing protein, partial [Litorimonas sp.]